MLPISGLKTPFLREQIDATKNCITDSGGDVAAIICDGNRINQSFMISYKSVPGTVAYTRFYFSTLRFCTSVKEYSQ